MALLPRAPIREYKRNEVIYRAEDRAEDLYVVINGRVKVSRPADGGREVVLAFYQKDDFFGEVGFLGSEKYGEQATALDKTSLMMWSIGELKRLMTRTPALGPVLLRALTQKLSDADRRIEGLCLDPIHRRLVKSLLYLGRRLGRPAENQMLHLLPITHEQLACYVGTSREIVTQYMNQFRREGLLEYSRRGIDLNVAALERHLASG